MKITKVQKTNEGIKIWTNDPRGLACELSDRLGSNNSRFDTIEIVADGIILSNWAGEWLC